MSKKLESQIQAECLRFLSDLNLYVHKNISTNRAGVPDAIMCYKGSYVAIEFKSPSGSLSELQKAHKALIQRAGGHYFVIRSLDEAKQMIKDLDEQDLVPILHKGEYTWPKNLSK